MYFCFQFFPELNWTKILNKNVMILMQGFAFIRNWCTDFMKMERWIVFGSLFSNTEISGNTLHFTLIQFIICLMYGQTINNLTAFINAD